MKARIRGGFKYLIMARSKANCPDRAWQEYLKISGANAEQHMLHFCDDLAASGVAGNHDYRLISRQPIGSTLRTSIIANFSLQTAQAVLSGLQNAGPAVPGNKNNA